MANEIADILERAADRLSSPGAWTQGSNARDADGRRAGAGEDRAICWCMAGAIFREAGEMHDLACDAMQAVKEIVPAPAISDRDPIVWFNDAPGRTQAEVVAKLREAALSVSLSEGGE